MTAHPLDTILQTGVPVSKGDFKDYARKTFQADSAAQVSDTDLAGTLFVLCPVSTGLGLFVYDASDTTSAQDVSAGILRSNDGRVYKREVLAASDIQSFILAAITAAGGLDAAQIASGTADTLLGRNGSGEGASLTMANLVALLDSFIGDSEWRSPVSQNNLSKIARFPENTWSGGYTFYALMSDGRVRACGDGAAFANGLESQADTDWLSAIGVIGGSPSFTKIWSGGAQCYALDSEGHLWAMGKNNSGQLGLGDTVNRAAFHEITYFRTNGLVVSDVVPMSSSSGGQSQAVVVLCENGKAYYCGANFSGQAGDGTTTALSTFVPWGDAYTAGGVTDIDAVWAAPGVVYVSRSNGDVIAAGYDNYGAFALGSFAVARSTPVKLTAISNAVQIASDGFTSFYRLADGSLKAAGDGASGQRGDGTTSSATTPPFTAITVSLGGDCLDVAVTTVGNLVSTCAAIVNTGGSDRTLKLWGSNSVGAAGDGTTNVVTVPFEPLETWNGSVDQVWFGGSFGNTSTYVRAGNTIYSCGYNVRANLVRAGTGDISQTTFGPVTGIVGTVAAVHGAGSGQLACLFVLTDKAALAGGQNAGGILGIGASGAGNFSTLQDMQAASPSGPNPVASPPAFTVATLPDAASYPVGTGVYVSDESGGAVTAFTDGSEWRRSTDRAVVT